MIKTNYHTHTYLCNHAKGNVEDYVKKAISLGYKELGMSDHGPFEGFGDRMSLDEFYKIYLNDLKDAIDKYSDKIMIYKALEMEYIPGYDDHYQRLLSELDYFILGQHYVIHDDKLNSVYKTFNDDLVLKYRDMILEALDTKYFKILAHPDIFMFKYQTWNALTEKVSRDIIKSTIKNGVFLEINANGMRRKKIINQDNSEVYIYPRIEFWKLVCEYSDAKIIINEDLHNYENMGDKYFDDAKSFAKSLNLKVEDYLF